MARELYVPGMLDPHIQTTGTEISFAYLSYRPKPSKTPFSEHETRQSLTQFAKNTSGKRLNEYMQSFAKEGRHARAQRVLSRNQV